jgi:predicted permease
MKPLRRAWKRLLGALFRNRREADLASEIQSHVEMLTEDNIARGMTPNQARRAAMITFGGVEAAKENYRDQRGLPGLESLAHDVRFAARSMRRNPAFTATVVACLGLGIGASTAIFSLFNAAMFRSLPVARPDRLVFFSYSETTGDMSAVRRLTTGTGGVSLPYATYQALRDQARSLAGVFVSVPTGFDSNSLTVGLAGRPFTADGELVTANYFAVLGVSPVMGRAFTESDSAAGAPDVAVVSHKFWQREFEGRGSVVGQTIAVNGTPYTLIGVAPAGFSGLGGVIPDFWFPLRPGSALRPWGSRSTVPDAYFTDRRWWWCHVGGRLKPGATRQQAVSEAQYLHHRSITAGVDNVPAGLPVLSASSVSPAFQAIRRAFSTPLSILLVTASLTLLMACANVATLLLARARARQKEIGVRLAIGASRFRVVRQLLTESVLLSAAGGALGLLFAHWGAPALLEQITGGYRQATLDVAPDATVLAFAAAVSLATGILFGLAPALRAARTDLAPQLIQAAASITPRCGMMRALVAAQIALSVVLLFAAGLFIRTLRNLDSLNLGFRRDNLLLFDLDPVRSGYTGDRGMSLPNRLAERVAALPGVRSVTYVQEALLSGPANSTYIASDGPQLPSRPRDGDMFNRVGPGFCDVMGIRVVLGRDIESRDTDGTHPAAIVNETWARTYFPNQSPLGHRISLGGERFKPEDSYEIVGVAADAKYNQIRAATSRTVYTSYGARWDRVRRFAFAVRSGTAPGALIAPITRAAGEVAPGVPVYNVRTQRQQIDTAIGTERMLANVSGFFGSLALVLVAIGVYGTLSYGVARRTSEIGIRVALGASRAKVVWMILRESLAVAAAGLAVGLPAALALSHLAESALFGIDAHDGSTAIATIAVLAGIAAVSGLVPANRAARIDPIRALRHE